MMAGCCSPRNTIGREGSGPDRQEGQTTGRGTEHAQGYGP